MESVRSIGDRGGIGFRAVGAINGNTIVWFWIGSHAEYDSLLANL